jgi:predicted amidophosphoribosyltransferase
MIKKTFCAFALFATLLSFIASLSGCAALWITGVVVAGATAYDLATYRECPNCKKIIRKDATTCPSCGKAVTPIQKKERGKQDRS